MNKETKKYISICIALICMVFIINFRLSNSEIIGEEWFLLGLATCVMALIFFYFSYEEFIVARAQSVPTLHRIISSIRIPAYIGAGLILLYYMFMEFRFE
jgi:xanthine/uracil permease